MPALKCPNPSCSYLLDPTAVPPGALLMCPQCHMRFTLGPAAGGSAPPPGPAAVPDPMAALDDSPAGGDPAPRRRSGGLGGTVLTVVGLVLFLAVGLGVGLIALRAKHGQTQGAATTGPVEVRQKDYNFAFRRPADPWADDLTAQNALGVNVLGLKRTGPDAWCALAVQDFQTRHPGPSELRKKVPVQLDRAFDNLPPAEDLKFEPATWAGQPAERCAFRGVYRPTGGSAVGDVHLLAFKGVGYWLYTWSAEADAATAAADLLAIRDGFRLLAERDRWVATRDGSQVIRSKSPLYKLTDHESIWRSPAAKDPTDEDPRADLIREATLKGRARGDFIPKAELVVMILDGGGDDPLAAAAKYIRKRYESRGELKVEELLTAPDGDPPAGPEDPGVATGRFRVVRAGGGAADQFVAYAAVAAGTQTVVAEAFCAWPERLTWERRLLQLVGTLKANP